MLEVLINPTRAGGFPLRITEKSAHYLIYESQSLR